MGTDPKGGTREGRTLRSVTVSLPPYIARIDANIDADIAVELEVAMSEISRLDSTHGTHLAALRTLLLRTESLASLKIEHVEASLDDYARALHGGRGNSSAVSMVAATTALNDMIASVDRDAPVQMSAIVRAHEALMRDDPTESRHAGQTRTVQNWIGGSDYSPRDALHVLGNPNAPRSSVFAAIKRLHDTGVLRPSTDRKRDQVWGASLVLDELDNLGHRIERAST